MFRRSLLMALLMGACGIVAFCYASDQEVDSRLGLPGAARFDRGNPTATPDQRPVLAVGRASVFGVNVHSGPGTNFDIVTHFPIDNVFELELVSPDGKWYQILYNKGQNEGWVFSAYVSVLQGDVSSLPVASGMTFATPIPGPSADNWEDVLPGQVLYIAKPEVSAVIFYSAETIESYVTSLKLQIPAADSESPALELLNQLKASLEDVSKLGGMVIEEDAFTGPVLETINGVETAFMRLKIDPQTINGREFPGLDDVLFIIDQGNGTITMVQYMLQGHPDEAIYADMRAWLEENIERLSTLELEE